ncbi:hypothetical protein GJ496_008995 [Pomphorhynchus laevis]|nr:hypothetical protein GJ496_008995 [Pomphorhynchus laevis]
MEADCESEITNPYYHHDPYLPISRQLQMYTLSDLLKSDNESRRKYDESLKWFVADCNRKQAETLLLEEYSKTKIDGTFVLRPCSKCQDDVCISVVCSSRLYHYRIYNFGDCYFKMENSKMFFGLDTLIDYCGKTKLLPTCLINSIGSVCSPIALKTRSKGIISILHKISSYGNASLFDEIIDHPLRGDIDERDPSGSTSLHIASSFGHCDIIERLILSAADIHKHDSNGRTCLHRAVEDDNPVACRLLIEAGADINAIDRNRSTPLHIAAQNNSYSCIKALLEHKATLLPRDKDLLTPWDLAYNNGNNESTDILKKEMLIQFTQSNTKLSYLFTKLSKAEAKELLYSAGYITGSFLIRRSETKNSYVLSMIANSEFCNYDIDTDKLGCYYICDGPLFFSLEQLVEYYSNCQDRLQAKLGEPLDVKHITNTKFTRQPIERAIGNVIRNANSSNADIDNNYSRNNIDDITAKQQHKLQVINAHSLRQNKWKFRRNSNQKAYISEANGNDDNGLDKSSRSVTETDRDTVSLRKNISFVNEQHFSINGEVKNSKAFRYIRMFNDFVKNGVNGSINNTVNNKISDRLNYVVNMDSKNSAKDLLIHRQEGLTVIHKSQFLLIKKIGEGEFGLVYEGSYSPDKSSRSITVAIKKLKILSPEAISDFQREAKIMSSLKHHCIVKIYGICEDGNDLMMIQEFLHYGSLLKLLRENRKRVSLDHIKKWALQIADGLNYIELKHFVHRDLSARNVLVASLNQVKVSDFGLSRSTTDNIYEQHSGGKIPVKWYAIEAIEKNRFTSKSDVWSFGVTLWEMFTYGKEPYENMTGIQVYEYVREGKKLSKPRLCSQSTYNIICKCTDLDENKRPTFQQLVDYFSTDKQFKNLDKIIKSIPVNLSIKSVAI